MVSIHSAVRYWAERAPQRCALIYTGQRIAYAELHRRVQHAAGLLGSRGIGKGDVVALLMKNSAAFIELSLARNCCWSTRSSGFSRARSRRSYASTRTHRRTLATSVRPRRGKRARWCSLRTSSA